MTAEVAVMNKLAVALAADSAVTFGAVKQQKIYNAANKLFSLSKHEPVGVMIYGNAEIMGVPWETILKVYREELGHRSFRRLPDYFDDLISFLDKGDRFFDQAAQERLMQRAAGLYYIQVRKGILQRIEAVIETQSSISDQDASSIVDQVIASHVSSMDAREYSAGLGDDHRVRLISDYGVVIRQTIADVFQKLPLSQDQTERLVHLGASLACRDLLSASRSGVVVAGFGRDDHYPALRAAELDGRASNRLHYVLDHEVDITTEMGASIVPFAQSDVVSLFIEGIDSAYEEMLHGYLDETFKEYPEELLKTLASIDEKQRATIIASWRIVGDQC